MSKRKRSGVFELWRAWRACCVRNISHAEVFAMLVWNLDRSRTHNSPLTPSAFRNRTQNRCNTLAFMIQRTGRCSRGIQFFSFRWLSEWFAHHAIVCLAARLSNKSAFVALLNGKWTNKPGSLDARDSNADIEFINETYSRHIFALNAIRVSYFSLCPCRTFEVASKSMYTRKNDATRNWILMPPHATPATYDTAYLHTAIRLCFFFFLNGKIKPTYSHSRNVGYHRVHCILANFSSSTSLCISFSRWLCVSLLSAHTGSYRRLRCEGERMWFLSSPVVTTSTWTHA